MKRSNHEHIRRKTLNLGVLFQMQPKISLDRQQKDYSFKKEINAFPT